MSARTVLTTDTLETFRTTFNSLSSTDIGDPATLTTIATSIVGAINEIDAPLSLGITLADDTSTTSVIHLGDTLSVLGGNNIESVVLNDSFTINLSSAITGLTSLDANSITINSVSVATEPFAVAQAIALG